MSGPLRVALSFSLIVLAAVLLVPAAAPERRVSWDDLIAPLGTGRVVTRGYVLSPPRRGEAHDVVYVARRDPGPAVPAARVEVHIVDRGRWRGAAETSSFGVDWELPPAGSQVVAPPDDARAVTRALAEAIAANDSGFSSVDSVPLASEPAGPLLPRILERLSGARGALIGGVVALALILLASVRHGPIVVGLLLFALGLALRAPALDLPFAHDQDVQRLLTGYLPLREIATGAGLRDRHPPLYFFILHFVELFGQSEAVVRAPAVVAGALVAPALLLAVASMCGRIGAAAVVAALALTISPELVLRSREVSEIPLFSLFVLAAAASLVAAVREPRRTRLAAVALSHALALFTYYLAPFIVAAHAAVLWRWKAERRVLRAFVGGTVLGAPALVLGIVAFLRDRGARATARAFPALAWGEHSPWPMLVHMGQIAAGAFGRPFLVLVLMAVVIGVARRNLAVIMPATAAAVTVLAIALLALVARVQGYYAATVLPLAALALAVVPEPEQHRHRIAGLVVLVFVIACSSVPALARAGSLYIVDADAFMPRFASVIARRPEERVVTVAHYDKTLLAYYLARVDGRSIGWDTMDDARAKPIDALVMVHALDANSEQTASRRLEAIIAAGPTLVIERDAFLLPAIVERLSSCERLLQAPTARLVRCAPPP